MFVLFDLELGSVARLFWPCNRHSAPASITVKILFPAATTQYSED